MSNIAAILKQEITRLARREARSLTKAVNKTSARFRKDIAELKRANTKANAEISRLQREVRNGVAAPIAESDAETIRFSAASVKAQRKRLGLAAADFGKLIGVTGHTVYSWEKGASRPRSAQLSAFGALRNMGKREVNERLEALRVKAPKGQKKAK